MIDATLLKELLFGGLTLFGIIKFGLTYYDNNEKRKLTNDKLFHELFIKFNERYFNLKDHLIAIREISDNEDYNDDEIGVFIDENPELYMAVAKYFTLCAEQHFWMKNKRINKKVWCTWKYGMTLWYENTRLIQLIWEYEKEYRSIKFYYLKEGEDLFKAN